MSRTCRHHSPEYHRVSAAQMRSCGCPRATIALAHQVARRSQAKSYTQKHGLSPFQNLGGHAVWSEGDGAHRRDRSSKLAELRAPLSPPKQPQRRPPRYGRTMLTSPRTSEPVNLVGLGIGKDRATWQTRKCGGKVDFDARGSGHDTRYNCPIGAD